MSSLTAEQIVAWKNAFQANVDTGEIHPDVLVLCDMALRSLPAVEVAEWNAAIEACIRKFDSDGYPLTRKPIQEMLESLKLAPSAGQDAGLQDQATPWAEKLLADGRKDAGQVNTTKEAESGSGEPANTEGPEHPPAAAPSQPSQEGAELLRAAAKMIEQSESKRDHGEAIMLLNAIDAYLVKPSSLAGEWPSQLVTGDELLEKIPAHVIGIINEQNWYVYRFAIPAQEGLAEDLILSVEHGALCLRTIDERLLWCRGILDAGGENVWPEIIAAMGKGEE